MSGMLCEKKLSPASKERIYTTVVRPAMLYGMETLTMSGKQEELDVAELKMLRFVLGVIRLDKITNEYIRGTARKVRPSKMYWRVGRGGMDKD